MEITRARASDASLLENIFSSLYRPKERWSESKIMERMEKGREFYLLEKVGALELKFDGDECELAAISVKTQGRGDGSKLLNFAEKLSKARGCNKIWCYTLEVNDATGFYKKNGWEEEKFIPDFFDGHGCYIFSKFF